MVSQSDGIGVGSALQRKTSCPLFGTNPHGSSDVALFYTCCLAEGKGNKDPMEADESVRLWLSAAKVSLQLMSKILNVVMIDVAKSPPFLQPRLQCRL